MAVGAVGDEAEPSPPPPSPPLSSLSQVDTGWINDEKPAARAAAHAAAHNFQTPIDEVDAAARILDPVVAPLRRAQAGEPPAPHCGVFLKDYAPCEW